MIRTIRLISFSETDSDFKTLNISIYAVRGKREEVRGSIILTMHLALCLIIGTAGCKSAVGWDFRRKRI